jgi:hypothetical protein
MRLPDIDPDDLIAWGFALFLFTISIVALVALVAWLITGLGTECPY